MNFGEGCFDTAALFNVRTPFQSEHFTASIVGFLPEPQRGDAAKSPDFPTEPPLPPHFIVPARQSPVEISSRADQ